MAVSRREFISGSAAGAAGLVVGGVLGKVVADDGDGGSGGATASGDVGKVAEARGLTPDDALRAVKTFVPPGQPQMDEFFLFSSGGHSGQVLVFGVPSMRLLKNIGVFTPESWQGWGYGSDGDAIFTEGTTRLGGGSSPSRGPPRSSRCRPSGTR